MQYTVMESNSEETDCPKLRSISITNAISGNGRKTYCNISMLKTEEFCDKADMMSGITLSPKNNP
jgi:hypothetical protein